MSSRAPGHTDVVLGSLHNLLQTLNAISSTLYDTRDRLFGSPPDSGETDGLDVVRGGKTGDIEGALNAAHTRANHVNDLATELQARL